MSLRDFFRHHAKVNSAQRWTCPLCQFESNEFSASHQSECIRAHKRDHDALRRFLSLPPSAPARIHITGWEDKP